MNARKGKTKYLEVKEVDRNLNKCILKIQEMLKNKTYKTSPYEVFFKKCGNKTREIYKLPYFPDRIVHWAIILVVEPIFLKKLNGCTHSAIPKRGIHSAFKQLDRYMRKDKVGTKYCLKLDITKYYPSINHDKLKKMYRNIFKDANLLWLLDEIIDSTDGEKGVPIGNYLSQYSGNLFLSSFDRWLKEKLKVKYYCRYMDDVIILHNDKQYLHILKIVVERYLKELNLEIKENWQIFPSRERGVDFVGYRHFGDYILLRKTTAKKLVRKMRNVAKKLTIGGEMTYSDFCSINSYKGWIKWCSGYNLYMRWIEPLEIYCDRYHKEVLKNAS